MFSLKQDRENHDKSLKQAKESHEDSIRQTQENFIAQMEKIEERNRIEDFHRYRSEIYEKIEKYNNEKRYRENLNQIEIHAFVFDVTHRPYTQNKLPELNLDNIKFILSEMHIYFIHLENLHKELQKDIGDDEIIVESAGEMCEILKKTFLGKV